MGTEILADEARSARIDTLRAVACILLVSYHVIGHDGAQGLRIATGSSVHTLVNFLTHVRMPLFAFLSGFVYASRPVRAGSVSRFALKKLRRLLIPLLVVTTLYYTMYTLAFAQHEMAPNKFWVPYVYPYGHLWFLQALLLLFAATILMECLGALGTRSRYFVVMGMVLALHFCIRVDSSPFGIRNAAYLAPFFFAGLGANRFGATLRSPSARQASIVVFIAAIAVGLVASFAGSGIPERQSLLATVVSLSACFALLATIPAVHWLAWVGTFSFSIYLYHLFFTAGSRVVALHLGLDTIPLLFLVSLTAGLVGPIVLELVVGQVAGLRLLLLGQSSPSSERPVRRANRVDRRTADARSDP